METPLLRYVTFGRLRAAAGPTSSANQGGDQQEEKQRALGSCAPGAAGALKTRELSYKSCRRSEYYGAVLQELQALGVFGGCAAGVISIRELLCYSICNRTEY